MTEPGPAQRDVTQLLRAWRQGDAQALERLTPLVYRELSRIAHRYMARERRGHTLETTALVHEAYLHLVDAKEVSWRDRTHFFAISARAMRRVLTDYARTRGYKKRGGGAEKLSIEKSFVVPQEPGADLVALDDALRRLSALDRRKAEVVELRFFGGLSVAETSEALNLSPETVMRDWKFAKAWLYRELRT
jgi:RNA polymerase sigma factor (TIGR02999 family)